MLINTRYVVVRRWSLYFITLDRPNTISPRFNLILGKLRAKIILTAWNIERSKIKDKVVDSWYLELQIFFFFQLLNLSSNRFLIKIEILRIVYYYERIISTIFLRLRLFMKRRCLIYVYSSLMARPATRRVLSFFGLFFQHISRGTACPTRGRKGLHSPRQKVINDRKTS